MRIHFAFIGLILLYSCHSDTDNSEDMGVFRYNEPVGINSLDPAFARTKSQIWPVTQLYNGLIEMNDQLEVIPSIAKSWEISGDNRVYTFFLRDDVKFHSHPAFETDSDKFVNAYDFEYSFRRILDPELMSPGRWVFSKLSNSDPVHPEGFYALNDSVFRIVLNEAFSPFLSLLSIPYCFVVPKEVVEYEGENFGRNPIGTGAFRFKIWREDEKLIFVKNDHYFEKDSLGIALPYLKAVSISFIKDKQSEFMEFLLGNLDILSGIHPSYKDELLTRSGHLNPKYKDRFQMTTQEYLNTEYLAFMVDDSLNDPNKALMNTDVRKAINYGFDREKMIKYLRNNIGKAAVHGMVPPGMGDYDNEKVSGYYYNPDTSLFLLAKAGYPAGEGLEIITLTTSSDYLDLCEFIQFEMQKIGIRINIELATGASFRNLVASANLPFFRASWIADYPDPESYLSLFYSKNFSPAGPNYTHFSSLEYDEIYERSNTIVEEDKRMELLLKMDQMIIDNAVVIPLYYDQVLRFTPLSINNLPPNPMNILKLKKVKKQLGSTN